MEAHVMAQPSKPRGALVELHKQTAHIHTHGRGEEFFFDANFDVHDDVFLHDDTVVMCVMMSLAKTGNKIEPPFSNSLLVVFDGDAKKMEYC